MERKKSLEKLKHLQSSISSNNILLSRNLGGSQPIVSNRKSLPLIKSHRLKRFHQPTSSTSSYTTAAPDFNRQKHNIVSLHSFQGSSKSCELLLGSHVSFPTVLCEVMENKDIEQEEKFLDEEMKTDWILKPTRSSSLAILHSQKVSTFIKIRS